MVKEQAPPKSVPVGPPSTSSSSTHANLSNPPVKPPVHPAPDASLLAQGAMTSPRLDESWFDDGLPTQPAPLGTSTSHGDRSLSEVGHALTDKIKRNLPPVISSRKQLAAAASMFIPHRKTRPEFHLDNFRVPNPAQTPTAHTGHDHARNTKHGHPTKHTPMTTFSSLDPYNTNPHAHSHSHPSRPPPQNPSFGQGALHPTQVAAASQLNQYIDPVQAAADLKDLLEGGMDEDEESETEAFPLAEPPSTTPPTLKVPEESLSPGPSEKKKTASDEKEQEKDADIPKNGKIQGLGVQLLPHQVEGVRWMRGRELGPVKRGKVPKGGILADDMGLGKTLQTVSLLLRNPKPANKNSPGWRKHYEGLERTTLVVAPLALIRQWEAEIEEKTVGPRKLRVYVHHGPQRTKNVRDLAQYDVVVTTYQILVSEFGRVETPTPGKDKRGDGGGSGCFGLRWWRVVLDEAHTIKNRNAKATKACCALESEFRWCLTGTPMQNNLDELQSLIHFLRIRPYDDLLEWREQIDKPMKNGRGHIAIRRLHSLLRCFMKRRTKAVLTEPGALTPGGLVEVTEVEKNDGAGKHDDPTTSSTKDPGFRVTERRVEPVSIAFTAAEKRFYERLEARADQSIQRMLQGRMQYANALVLLLRLRQACDHPKLVEGKLDRDSEALTESRGGGNGRRGAAAANSDVDDMAALFSGMTMDTKECGICGRGLPQEAITAGQANCRDCEDDLRLFYDHSDVEHEESPDATTRKQTGKSNPSTSSKSKSRSRPGRNVIVDSDDEDDEKVKVKVKAKSTADYISSDDDDGSWLVGEEERGPLRLGKTGTQSDEDAAGGGEWLGQSDFESEEEDQSRLDSFVVDDDTDGEDSDGLDRHFQNMTIREDDSDPEGVGRPPKDGSIRSKTTEKTSKMETSRKPSGKSATRSPPPKSTPSRSRVRRVLDSEDEDTDDTSNADSDSASDSASASASASQVKSASASPQVKSGGRRGGLLPSAKVRKLLEILDRETKQHKFIVFSQFTSMLDLVEPFLRKAGLVFTRYDGGMRNDEREASLHRLRHDPATRILLCSLKCGSLGLNLTAATRVVILEPFWNPFIEEQAIDRVHRLTQKVDVVVYKLTVAGTVEERILGLQERKRLLAEQAIEGGMRKGAFKLGMHEMLDLFRGDGVGGPSSGGPPDTTVVAAGGGPVMESGGILRPRTDPAKSKSQQPGRRREESEAYGRRW